jgi:signal transduction histidine kinase/ligand-binding sensor domain-containing protein/CheY-like chemotaxis protein
VWTIFQDYKGFIWFGTNNGLARYDGYNFKSYQPNDDNPNTISHKGVSAIFADKQNGLWLILQSNGINYFNPVTEKFEHFFYNPSDPHSVSWSSINCYLCDSKNNIWFGTIHGLNRYNPANKGFDKYYSNPDNNALPDNNINDIKEDNKGNLWIATNRGVAFINISNNKITRLASLAYHPLVNLDKTVVRKIHPHTDGLVWMCTQGEGVLCYNSVTGTLVNYKSKIASDNLPTSDIVSLYANSVGDIFFFSNTPTNQIFLLKKDSGKFQKYKVYEGDFGIDISNFTEDQDHNLWFSTSRYLLKYDYSNHRFETFQNSPLDQGSIVGNRLEAALVDRNNILWVSIYKKGIDKTDLNGTKFRYYKKGIHPLSDNFPENNIIPLFQDKQGNYWIGTQENGVIKFDRHWRKKNHYTVNQKDPAKLRYGTSSCGCEDKYGNIWIGSWSGAIEVINPRTNKIRHLNSSVRGKNYFEGWEIRSIKPDSDGNLWIASTSHGIIEYVIEKDSFIYHSYYKDPDFKAWGYYRTLYIDKRDDIWFGCQTGGLHLFDRASNKFAHFQTIQGNKQSINNNTVYSIYQENDSIFWVGTAGGINRFNFITKKFSHFTTNDGLCNNTAYSVLPDGQGNLWISTDYGLSKFNIQKHFFSNYYEGDGLISNEFNSYASYKSPDGELFFGSANGMISFFPSSIERKTYTTVPVFTDLKIFNKIVAVGDTIMGKVILQKTLYETEHLKLAYFHSVFTIEFSALYYASPDKIKYEYKLENFDKNWIQTDSRHRFATYTNLPAGNYTFLLRSTNNEGAWNNTKDEAALQITITPPFWKTLWFKIIIISAFIYSIISFFNYRTFRLRKQKVQLAKMVKERTWQLEEANTTLEEKQEEITIQNEELQVQKENLQHINSKLEEQKQEIENQKNELDQHRNHLEQLVKDRTADLVAAMKKVEESDRLKSAFLANMSHEIRTPLNAIVGFSSLLTTSNLNAAEKEQFSSYIKKNSEALLLLINDILEMSQIEANQLIIHNKQVNIIEILQELFTSFRMQAHPKGISLTLDTGSFGDNLTTSTDPYRLKQILSNLISNALKFTEKGSVIFGVTGQIKDFLTFYVKDTGIGIPKEAGNTIFERFLKVQSTETRFYEGVGLGLSICKSLAKAMGGSIWYESELGKGTTFYFTIPGTSEKNISKADVKGNYDIPDLSNKHILIAEDEEANYRLIEYYLTNTKANITWARNGLDAVECVKRNNFDLILMDLKMPVMDGIEATNLIRQIKPEQLIVAQTAFAYKEEKAEFLKSGFNGYLVKPINTEKLTEILNELFGK